MVIFVAKMVWSCALKSGKLTRMGKRRKNGQVSPFGQRETKRRGKGQTPLLLMIMTVKKNLLPWAAMMMIMMVMAMMMMTTMMMTVMMMAGCIDNS